VDASGTKPAAEDPGSELIEALPPARAEGEADAGATPATWAEFRRSADAGDEVDSDPAVPAAVGGPGAAGGYHEPELAHVRHRTLWHALTHLSDPRERRILGRYLRQKRGLFAGAAVVLIGAVSVLVALMLALARSAPAWWVDVDTADPRMIELAELVQNGALSHLFEDRESLVGGGVEWPVKMTDEAANAWMNIKLPEWFAKISDGMDWPDSVQQLQMVFDSGTVRIGARVRTEIGTRIYSCAIIPELREDGSLWMKASTVSMGRVTLPASWVLRGADASAADYIPEQLRGTAQAEALFEKLTGQLPLFDKAEVSLGDGRRVRLLGLRVRDGTVIAHCVTENPE